MTATPKSIRIKSAVVVGIDAVPVELLVEHRTGTLPAWDVTGQSLTAAREMAMRVRSALKQTGYTLPVGHTVVSAAATGTALNAECLDFPVALALLALAGIVPAPSLVDCIVVGELDLAGGLRSVRGVVSTAQLAVHTGQRLFVPTCDLEAARVASDSVAGFDTLAHAAMFLRGEAASARALPAARRVSGTEVDMADVVGHADAKHVLERAAAEDRNVLLVGPPGAGKSMLARRFASILPAMTAAEALDVTRIRSACGMVGGDVLATQRPFRAPHHTISDIGLVGGGVPPRPGEATLAHNGVLFLDDLPEFRRAALDALRPVLETGEAVLRRSRYMVQMPARFRLVAAMNPCPCGWHGAGAQHGRKCVCTPEMVERYKERVAAFVARHIPVVVRLEPVPYREVADGERGDDSATIRARVEATRTAAVDVPEQSA